MPEPTVRRARRGPATPETVEALHEDLDQLWSEAAFVPDTDRMAFTLAVIEAASNAVVHAVPAATTPLQLEVELTAGTTRLEARIHEIGAAPAHLTTPGPLLDIDPEDESGRGMAMIRALVTAIVFERHDDTNTWVLHREYPQP